MSHADRWSRRRREPRRRRDHKRLHECNSVTECSRVFLSDIMAYGDPMVDPISKKYLTLEMVEKPCCLRLCSLLGVLKSYGGHISMNIESLLTIFGEMIALRVLYKIGYMNVVTSKM